MSDYMEEQEILQENSEGDTTVDESTDKENSEDQNRNKANELNESTGKKNQLDEVTEEQKSEFEEASKKIAENQPLDFDDEDEDDETEGRRLFTHEEKIRVVEAALFMSPGTMKLTELAKVCRTNIPEIRICVNELMHEYNEKTTSLTVVDDEDGVKMKVKPQYDEHVMFLATSPAFHKGVMKTLAYIAYKQPVLQSEVIHFRNSKAYEHIKLLKEKGFIKKEKQGITYKLYTTKKFQDYFGKVKQEEKKLQQAKPQQMKL